MRIGIFLLIIFAGLICGCSGAGDVTIPEADVRTPSGTSHQLWGLYQFIGYPGEARLDVVQLRVAGSHLNVLPFLEPPAFVNLLLVGEIVTSYHSIKCTVGLRHPFTGLDEFSGFDVSGILISKGSITPYEDTDLVMAGPNDPHLMNPDGWSRWWNPTEFPHVQGSISAYNDGMLGTPHSIGQFTATLNGYKYFTDNLGPEEPLSAVDPTKRGLFSAGTMNTREYYIEYGSGALVFNYAIDASWQQLPGPGPWSIPDDFPPGANRPEAWYVKPRVMHKTLWNDGNSSGGDLLLHVDVYDHFYADLNLVRIESAGNFTTVESTNVVETGDGYATYEVFISDATPSQDSIELFISVESNATGYGGALPGEKVTSYFTKAVVIGDTPPVTDYDLILDVERSNYLPPAPDPDTNKTSWITGIKLSWNNLPGGAEYAICRSLLWESPYSWEVIGTTGGAVLEFTNTTGGANPIDWDEDYIYEVRPRSIPNDAGSEGTPTERALVVMESNDDYGPYSNNPQWESRYGLGGSFNCYYSSANYSCDEGYDPGYGYIVFDTMRSNSWGIAYLPNAVPDLTGQSSAYIDFGFSTYYGNSLPDASGFVPGTMTAPPVNFQLYCYDFEPAADSDHMEGLPYNNTYCQGVLNHFGGTSSRAYSGQFTVYKCARFSLPRLLETDADYVGIGIASWNVPYSTALHLGIDSIAVAVY